MLASELLGGSFSESGLGIPKNRPVVRTRDELGSRERTPGRVRAVRGEVSQEGGCTGDDV